MKRKLCVFICFIILVTCLFSTNFAYAHEIFYNGSTPIVLKWNYVNGSTVNMKMSDDLLDAPFTSHYSVARNAWPNALANASTHVSITNSSFSESNIDLATADSSYWEDRWGILASWNILGVCDVTSTDGILIDSAADALASSKLIKYAGILFNPSSSAFDDNSTKIRYTMVHEIGHAFGLGHPNTDHNPTSAASVMRTGESNNYYTPQAHDISDMNSKY